MEDMIYISYLISAVFFILALRGLSSPETARRGNLFGIAGMAIAILATFSLPKVQSYTFIIMAILIGGIIGIRIARKIDMTAMPQLVAAFHSLVGLAAVFIATAALYNPESYGINIESAASLFEMGLGAAIGAITFSGSIIAFLKLQGIMSGRPIRLSAHKTINLLMGLAILVLLVIFVTAADKFSFLTLTFLAFIIGFLLIIPIGGADMPVIVSMLNSYSGWAAVGIGFTLSNPLLIITGSLVGASGAILSYIMCKAMNRSLLNVMFGGFSDDGSVADGGQDDDRPVKSGAADDAAFMLKNAASVIIVPGYGMAVAQAQHAIKEMVDILEEEGVEVKFAIHPVAGRMPGHMNVLLAEANIPYDSVFELEEINNDFTSADVALVIGANDVTNPAAKNDKHSPLYGMPILDVHNSKTVLFIKRSMSSGYAGIQNELFFNDNTMMLFDDAKKMVENIVKGLK